MRRAALLSLQGGDPEETDTGVLKELAVLPNQGNVQQLCWHPTGTSAQLVTIDDKTCAQQWSLEKGGGTPTVSRMDTTYYSLYEWVWLGGWAWLWEYLSMEVS